mmetsp:Transcript_8114/g.11828  ORF Transcript_8114/g.11828 Transcript_8114/m.11828 type:complete len:232 (+) Transcript_8114:2814-3509(+)
MLGSESCDQPLQTNPTSAPSSKPSVAPRGNVGNSRMGMVGLGSLSSSKVGSSAHHMESTATSKAQDSRTSPTATLKVEEGRQKASHVHGAPTQMLPKLQKHGTCCTAQAMTSQDHRNPRAKSGFDTDSFQILVDNCASSSITNTMTDFVQPPKLRPGVSTSSAIATALGSSGARRHAIEERYLVSHVQGLHSLGMEPATTSKDHPDKPKQQRRDVSYRAEYQYFPSALRLQ